MFTRRLLVIFTFLLGWFVSESALALEMKAGTAKGVITPEAVRGRISVMGNPLQGVVHDIHARVLTLYDGEKRLVIVTYDLNCLDVATPLLRVRCRDELGIDPAYLVLLATHNHSAPIQIVPDNFDYGRWLADRIFALIQEAIAHETGPVRVMFGSGEAQFVMSANEHGYLHMLLVGDKPVDYEVQLLQVMKGDKVLAMLFNQAAHPLHETRKNIGVAHPGYAMDEIERQMPGTLALYADACGGNQFIKKAFVLYAPLSKVQAVGRELAQIVLEISRGPLQDVTGTLHSRLTVISLPLAPPVSSEEALRLARRVPRDIGFVPYPHPDRESNWIRSLLEHYEKDIPFPSRTTDRVCTDDGFLVRELPEPREFPCVYEETIVARIGPMIFVAMQGEVCAPIGLKIKETYRGQMPLMVFAYMGEHNLYIPTRALVRRNAYQAQVIQIQYASPVGWAEEVEEEMVQGVLKIIEEMK